ncbi:unknown [Clostridium sp. CAG:793]|nr:unknown [Clostridium sp. CAG:793]
MEFCFNNKSLENVNFLSSIFYHNLGNSNIFTRARLLFMYL